MVEDEALEGRYWQELLEKGPAVDRLTEAVLDRFQPDAGWPECLLRIAPVHKALLRLRFQENAARRLRDSAVEADRWSEVIKDSLELGSITLEDHGLNRQAAAFYALAHDQIVGRTAGEVYERLSLRLGICRTLQAPNMEPGRNARFLVALAQQALEESSKINLKQHEEMDRTLLQFELYYWLGQIQVELGEHESAVHSFSGAVDLAVDADDRVVSKLRRAGALKSLGQLQEAYSEYLEMEGSLQDVEDRSLLEWWEVGFNELKGRLTGYVGQPRRVTSGENAFLEIPAMLMNGAMRGGCDLDSFGTEMDVLANRMMAERTWSNRTWDHNLLLQKASALMAQKRFDEGNLLLLEAEQLEGELTEEAPKRQRLALKARMLTKLNELEKAKKIFDYLLPRELPTADFLGFYLEALRTADDPDLIFKLSDLLGTELSKQLGHQPTPGARRYTRTMQQRAIEAALLALTRLAHNHGSDSTLGQRALIKAWRLIAASRNLALRATSPEPLSRQKSDRLRELESVFHGLLRSQLLDRQSSAWEAALEEVFDYEAAEVPDQRLSQEGDQGELSGRRICLAFFEIGYIIPEPVILIVSCYNGRYDWHSADVEQCRRLAGWAQKCSISPFENGPSFRDAFEVPDAEATMEAQTPFFDDLLPSGFKLWKIADRIAALGGGPKDNPDTWATAYSIFPSGFVYKIPIELLALKDAPGEYFGSGRSVQLCLRAGPPIASKIAIGNGWLGVGGVPSAPGFSELEGALEEINSIGGWLKNLGVDKVDCLTGSAANAEGLEAKLKELNPAVLHLAVHGAANEDYPDACALILAPCLGRPENEVWPFRRICRLPARGLELVVLSACSSLIGTSDVSAGMQGLAWAFLQAGAKQVIASRYRVNDQDTAQFMKVFYRYLLTLPAAEALGRTRQECLADHMHPYSVGAFSVWT